MATSIPTYPTIVYTDLSDYSWAATYTSASNPLTNLSDYDEETQWMSGNVGTGAQQIQVDFGSAVTIDSVVIANHNLGSTGATTATIDGANDSLFTSGVYNAVSSVTSSTDPLYFQFTSAGRQHWRIYLYKLGGLTTAPIIGNVYFGEKLTFNTSYDWNYKTENAQYETSEKTSLDGTIRTSQVYAGRIIYELKFSLQDNTLKTAFTSFQRTVRGKMYPFYFIDTDGTVRFMHMTDDYVPIESKRYNLNDISLKMKTAGATY